MNFLLQEDTAVMTDSFVEFPVDTLDKETNTECVFIPEKGVRKRGSGEEPARAIVIKRSQTFSPSAAVSRNQYICRVSHLSCFQMYLTVHMMWPPN